MAEPQRITRAQFQQMGGVLDEPQKVTRAQFEAMGGKLEGPAPTVSEDVTESGGDRATNLADHLTDQVHLSHGPKTTGFLNALDSASAVGLPTVLGGLDAITGKDSGEDAKSIGKDPRWKEKGLLDRYYQNKDFYKGGMQRLADTNPKSAIAGQIAPALVQAFIPGVGAVGGGTKVLSNAAKLAKIAKFGAGTGAATGLLRGDAHTLGGDIEGTAEDTGIGAGLGAAGSLVGAAAGKLVQGVGNQAAKAGNKIMGAIRAAAKSEQAGFAKEAQMGIGADRNIGGDLERLEEKLGLKSSPSGNTTVPMPGAADPKIQNNEAWLAQKGVKYDEKAKQNLLDLRAKYGDRAMPPIKDMVQRGLEKVRGQANAELGGALKQGVAGAALGAAGHAVGIPPGVMGAMGGVGTRQAVMRAAKAAVNHPDIIGALMKLRPVGQALAITGGNAGALGAGRQTPEVRAALLYSLAQKDPQVREALLRETGSGTPAR